MVDDVTGNDVIPPSNIWETEEQAALLSYLFINSALRGTRLQKESMMRFRSSTISE